MRNVKLQKEITVIQHNVLSWTSDRSKELSNYYNRLSPEILLLNSTSTQSSNIKISNYNIHCRNYMSKNHAGIAIGVRKDVSYKILDNFNDDFIGIQVDTTKGPIAIHTTYIPPRRNYLPVGDIKRAMQRTIPTYVFGDLNAQCPVTGYNYSNNKGRILNTLIAEDTINYIGPDFPILVGRNGRSDALLANRWAFLNVAVQAGNVTSSDHIPIIVQLSTKPILKNTKAKFNYQKANWVKYKDYIQNNTEITCLNNKMKDAIDNEVKKWMTTITKAAETSIPQNKNIYFIHPQESDLIKILENTYIQIKNNQC